MIVKTDETKVKNTCDQLIAWGFCCNKPAAFLVEKLNTTEYAIMCANHKAGFERIYSSSEVVFHQWTLELNQKFADRAEKANAEIKQRKVNL